MDVDPRTSGSLLAQRGGGLDHFLESARLLAAGSGTIGLDWGDIQRDGHCWEGNLLAGEFPVPRFQRVGRRKRQVAAQIAVRFIFFGGGWIDLDDFYLANAPRSWRQPAFSCTFAGIGYLPGRPESLVLEQETSWPGGH